MVSFVRVLFINPISNIRIVEYPTISVLEYFKNTLANVGLLEDILKSDLNCVTWVKINTFDVSGIKLGKKWSLIKPKTQLSLIKSKTVSKIKSKR